MHYGGGEFKGANGKMIRYFIDKKTDKPVPSGNKLSAEDIRRLNEYGKCPGSKL